jgi:glycosyltransferase involved in cell wall biosynthesis
MLVSVCMIVRDEESNLDGALKCIPNSFEKVVVDTGSTDNSIVLAKRLGTKVSSFTWIDDFAAARNYSVSLANENYILIMDAEVLAANIENQIERFIVLYPEALLFSKRFAWGSRRF